MKQATKIKSVKKARKVVSDKVKLETSELKRERRTLRATISFLSTSDSADATAFREFLNLKKNANKPERERVALRENYIHRR